MTRYTLAKLVISEINAASSITALTFSPLFDFTCTYFLIAGIAGINPEIATLGSVTFARYAVQVALQYEFDAREIPANFTTGSVFCPSEADDQNDWANLMGSYVPQGSTFPSEYPQSIYGKERFFLGNTAYVTLLMKVQRHRSFRSQ